MDIASFSPTDTVTAGAIHARAAAIGIPSVAIDGNDVECVQNSAGEAIARARAGDGPSFIEAQTYRLRGHAEAEVYWLSERYRTDDEIARWQAKDPLLLFAEKLQRDRVADAKELAAVDTADDRAHRGRRPTRSTRRGADAGFAAGFHTRRCRCGGGCVMAMRRLIQAINDALIEEMERNPRIVLFGEDVKISMFGDTKGLAARFGASRVRNTPIAEETLSGMAVGVAATGRPVILHLMFSNFLYPGFDGIANQMTKLPFMTGGQIKLPITMLCAYGGGTSTAAQHSDTPYAMLMRISAASTSRFPPPPPMRRACSKLQYGAIIRRPSLRRAPAAANRARSPMAIT